MRIWLSILLGIACLSMPAAVPAGSRDVSVGQYFWLTPAGQEAFRDLLYFEPSEGAWRPYGPLYDKSRFQVRAIKDKWVQVWFDKDTEGWLYVGVLGNRTLVLNEEPGAAEQRRRSAEKKALEDRIRQMEGERISQINASQWPERSKDLARQKKIEKGMRPEMVNLSLGPPLRIVETELKHTKEERWFYPGGTILFFQNDELVGWQRER